MTDFVAEGERARQEALRMFHRTLASWAQDYLALRRAGLDRPSVRFADRPAQPMRRAA